MSDKVLNEHYVPRRYLRHFAKDEHFFAFDKEKNEPRPGHVDDYACERYFYDVDFDAIKADILKENPNFEFEPDIEKELENMDVQHLEHWFGDNVETWLFDPIDRIITSFIMCDPSKLNLMDVLSENDMAHIALYMSMQVLRSKEFRESMVELYERAPLLLMKKMAKTDEEKKMLDSFELKVKNKNYKKFLHAQVLTDPEVAMHLAGDFGGKIWIIGYNKTDMDFLTSDNPIVKFGHNGYSGFNSEGIEIFFPINTKLVLILKDPKYFWYESSNHNHFVEIPVEDVAFMNSLQLQQSYRYVFDKTGNFELVKGMMKRNPKLKDIKHKRFFMG